MSNNGRTKLELSEKGLSTHRRQSKRRKPAKKKEQVQEPSVIKVERVADGDSLNVVFKPNTGPQTDFLEAGEREVLYGGSAGGGKSYAMLADPLRYLGHPSFSGLLLSHTTEELRELVWKSHEISPNICNGRTWPERKMQRLAPQSATTPM